MKARVKNNIVIIVGYIWALGILVGTGFSILSGGTFASIWGSVGIFYITYKFSVKTRGKSQLSLLALWFLLIGGLSLFVAFGEGFLNKEYIYTALLPVAAMHVLVAFWAFQNLEDEPLETLSGKTKKRISNSLCRLPRQNNQTNIK